MFCQQDTTALSLWEMYSGRKLSRREITGISWLSSLGSLTSQAMSIWFNFLKESSRKPRILILLLPGKKPSGELLAAEKKVFIKEVPGWRGHMQIFETNSTKTFIHKLSIHGFSKIEGNSPIPASPEKLQALAAADSAFGKVNQSLCTLNNYQDIRVG